jgi:hypothetical protein
MSRRSRTETTQARIKRVSPPALSLVGASGALEPVVIEATPAPPPEPELSFPPAAKPETMAQRVKRLQAEAKSLAKDHVLALAAALNEASVLAYEIAEGGDAYPTGVREMSRRLIEETGARAQALESLVKRA